MKLNKPYMLSFIRNIGQMYFFSMYSVSFDLGAGWHCLAEPALV